MPKPPQAAVVKSHGGERCGNAGTMIPAGVRSRSPLSTVILPPVSAILKHPVVSADPVAKPPRTAARKPGVLDPRKQLGERDGLSAGGGSHQRTRLWNQAQGLNLAFYSRLNARTRARGSGENPATEGRSAAAANTSQK